MEQKLRIVRPSKPQQKRIICHIIYVHICFSPCHWSTQHHYVRLSVLNMKELSQSVKQFSKKSSQTTSFSNNYHCALLFLKFMSNCLWIKKICIGKALSHRTASASTAPLHQTFSLLSAVIKLFSKKAKRGPGWLQKEMYYLLDKIISRHSIWMIEIILKLHL